MVYMLLRRVQVYGNRQLSTVLRVIASEVECSGMFGQVQALAGSGRFADLLCKLFRRENPGQEVQLAVGSVQPVLIDQTGLGSNRLDVLIVFERSETVPHLGERPGTVIPDVLALEDDSADRDVLTLGSFLKVHLDVVQKLPRRSR